MQPLQGRTVLLVVNVDWFFLSHRLPVARAARDLGARVVVATGDTGRGHEIEEAGFTWHEIPFSRQGSHPLGELRAVLRLLRLYLRVRPDLVHHVTVKPVLYGSLLARVVLPGKPVINAISGLGFAFSSDARAKRLGGIVRGLYRLALRHPHSRTIFQNPDDLARFVGQGVLPPERAVLIRGSGVDVARYAPPAHPPTGPPVVLMSSRLLWEKGVGDFVQAARLVQQHGSDARFVLAGDPDPGTRRSVPRAALEQWVADGAIEWLGHVTDMPGLLHTASIYVLPTYYPEGVPKALLEAGSTRLPLVATDVPGCREVVEHEVTGLLVPPTSPAALADAVLRLLADPRLAQRLAAAAQDRVHREFSEQLVLSRTMDLYSSALLGSTRTSRTDM